MACKPLHTYLVFFTVQLLLRFMLFGGGPEFALHIFGAIPFSAILYFLCLYKYFTAANVLVGLTILLGIYADIFMVTHRTQVKKIMHGNYAGLHR